MSVDHLSGDEWMKLYPNLFPPEKETPKPEPVLSPGPMPTPQTHPLDQHVFVHAMASVKNRVYSVCGIQSPPRGTSMHDYERITCPKCRKLLNI